MFGYLQRIRSRVQQPLLHVVEVNVLHLLEGQVQQVTLRLH